MISVAKKELRTIVVVSVWWSRAVRISFCLRGADRYAETSELYALEGELVPPGSS